MVARRSPSGLSDTWPAPSTSLAATFAAFAHAALLSRTLDRIRDCHGLLDGLSSLYFSANVLTKGVLR